MTDYPTLKADLLSWSDRDDLSGQFPAFIRIAEAEIGRVVRSMDMETDTTLSASGPSFEANLPSGFLGFKHIVVAGGNRPEMDFLPPQEFAVLKASFTSSSIAVTVDRGNSTLYTIESNKVKIAALGSGDPVSMGATYYQKFTALSDSNVTNPLITNQYDLYLYASLAALWSFVENDAQETKYIGKFRTVVEQINVNENGRRRISAPLKSRPPDVVV